MFPSYPGRQDQPATEYLDEYIAAQSVGFKTCLINTRSISNIDPVIYNVPRRSVIMYRGYSNSSEFYKKIENTVKSSGSYLFTNNANYLYANNFQYWFNNVADTPTSLSIPKRNILAVSKKISNHLYNNLAIGGGAVVRDCSRVTKRFWHETCYMPDILNVKECQEVIENYLDLVKDNLYDCLVIRKFIKLKIIGTDPVSKMPLANEHRFFFKDGQFLFNTPVWGDQVNYKNSPVPPVNTVYNMTGRIGSSFFSADLAEKIDGSWALIDINDAGTSTILKKSDILPFYQKLYLNIQSSDINRF